MSSIIYYYTGTGNSLWTARALAEKLGDTELIPMHQMNHCLHKGSTDVVGLVFPVHMWGVPHLVRDFLRVMVKQPGAYYFAVAVNAGQVSRTLLQLKELMAQDGLTLYAGFDIELPSNYIPWGGPGPLAKQQELFCSAKEKIALASSYISDRKSGFIEKGPLWQRLIFTLIYKVTYKRMRTMDKNFNISGECSSCGICERVCPAGNILLQAEKPAWHGNCEQCLACIQWCQSKCIQYGDKTKNYERYHHPEVQVRDVVRKPRSKETT